MGRVEAAIRPARVGDIPGIQTVARRTWAVAYVGVIPDEIQRWLLDTWYSASALTRALGARESAFFVAEGDGNLVGFAQFVRRSAESAQLTRIYVLPQRQDGGIGTRLLEAGLAAIGQQGVSRLTVQVERDNAVGRRFYRRMGFAEVRELSDEVEGHSLALVRCERPVYGDTPRQA